MKTYKIGIFYRSTVFMVVLVRLLFESLTDNVITEISESEMSLCVVSCKKLFEGCLGIVNNDVPILLKLRCSFNKLSLRDSSVLVQLDALEVNPEFIVESQVDN